MLELREVDFEVEGKKILRKITMRFEEGKKYSILGMNGAGKSTIAYIIMGLEGYKPTSGRVYLDGQDITDLPVSERARRGITLLWQEPARFKGLTVKDYLTLGGKLSLKKEEMIQALELVGLSPLLYLNRAVDESLSGGERKRIELASVLLLKPRYAVLDEPDSGIDIMSLDMIKDVINWLSSYGGTPILITHREEVALETDESYLVCNGIILKKGRSQELVEYYRETCDRCDHINIPIEKVEKG